MLQKKENNSQNTSLQFWLQLRIIFKQLFTKQTKILFVMQTRQTKAEKSLRHIIAKKEEIALYNWTYGFITNFAEVLMSYIGTDAKFKHSNILNLRWSAIDVVFFTQVPTNKDIIKEWLLLKRVLNIKIVALVDQTNNHEKQFYTTKEKNEISSLIDYAIPYTSFTNKQEILLFLQKTLQHNVKCEDVVQRLEHKFAKLRM